MGWTDPTTRVVGELITAVDWNTDLVDNLLMLAGLAVPGCRITYEGSSVPYVDMGVSSPWEGQLTTVPFDTVDYDPAGQADLAAGKITVPSTGYYLVSFGTQISGTTAAATFMTHLFKNGALTGVVSGQRTAAVSGSVANWVTLTASDVISLTTGDALSLYSLAYLASSSMPSLVGATPSPTFLSAVRVR